MDLLINFLVKNIRVPFFHFNVGMYNFSQTVLFSFLRRPFPPGWGGFVTVVSGTASLAELWTLCSMPIVNFFLTVVQNSVINSYRSLYSLPGSTSTFLLLLLSASTLIVKTFEDGDGDSLKVNEKCVKNDDTKKNNNTVVKLKLLLQYVVSEIAKSSLKVLVSNKDTNNVRAPKKVSSSLLAARCRSTTRARRRWSYENWSGLHFWKRTPCWGFQCHQQVTKFDIDYQLEYVNNL